MNTFTPVTAKCKSKTIRIYSATAMATMFTQMHHNFTLYTQWLSCLNMGCAKSRILLTLWFNCFSTNDKNCKRYSLVIKLSITSNIQYKMKVNITYVCCIRKMYTYLYWFLISTLQFKLGKYKEGKHLPTCTMTAYSRKEGKFHSFLTTVLDGSEWSASYPDSSATHWTRG